MFCSKFQVPIDFKPPAAVRFGQSASGDADRCASCDAPVGKAQPGLDPANLAMNGT